MKKYINNYFNNIIYIKKNSLIIIICSMLYLLNKIVFLNTINTFLTFFLKCYFNDILAGLVIISLFNILIIITFSIKINKYYYILLLLLIIGLFWEYSPKLIRKNAVSDIIDIFAYEFGGLLYWFINQINLKYE